jgi:phosphomannomutase
MTPGFACLNVLTVQQASQGLALCVEESITDAKKKGIVIGCDARFHSKEFAEITAKVFASRGFNVYLYSTIVPTSYVPFGVVTVGAACGVMVTASHNPKDDNGYKVYWDSGTLIVSPVDTNVTKHINDNLKPWDLSGADMTLITDPLDRVNAAYMNTSTEHLCFHKEENSKTDLKVIYTAMHGVGTKYVLEQIEKFGLPRPELVARQVAPDPSFPTAPFPNPEERGALRIAKEDAEKLGCSIILATDPDADRLAVAERQGDGSWFVLHGNDIGILLADWYWESYHRSHPEVAPIDCCMLTTAVSSGMLQALCNKEGIFFEETLTGFKWLGSVAHSLIKEKKKTFLFAYEEAIGYLLGDMSLDKDGVRAAAVLYELAAQLAAKGETLWSKREEIFKKIGFFAANNHYFFCHEPSIMKNVFDKMRHGGNYLDSIGEYKVTRVRDLTEGYDSLTADHLPTLPVSKSTQMITFFFENGCVATLRGSGTEPKLKYYIEHHGAYEEKEKVKAELDSIVKAIIKECLDPETSGLIAPRD